VPKVSRHFGPSANTSNFQSIYVEIPHRTPDSTRLKINPVWSGGQRVRCSILMYNFFRPKLTQISCAPSKTVLHLINRIFPLAVLIGTCSISTNKKFDHIFSRPSADFLLVNRLNTVTSFILGLDFRALDN